VVEKECKRWIHVEASEIETYDVKGVTKEGLGKSYALFTRNICRTWNKVEVFKSKIQEEIYSISETHVRATMMHIH